MTTITNILGGMPLMISRDPLFYSLAVGTVLPPGGIVPVPYTLFFRVKSPAN